jgi:hypothetical protein
MKVSAAKKSAFADLLVEGQTPETAAKAIGIDRRTAYRWKAADPVFAEHWDEARERKIEVVEATLYQMAIEKDLGAVKEFLRAYRPEVFNRRPVIEVTNNTAIGIDAAERGEVVHFFLPPNFRDRPEEIEADAEPVIEGKAEAEDAA